MSEAENQSEAQPAPARGAGLSVNVFGRTDVGLIREHNEDNFLVADLTTGNRSIKPEVREHSVGEKGSLFAVCDGMGGAAAGEVASRMAVDTIYEMMQAGGPPSDDEDMARRLEAAIIQAGKRIFAAAKEDRKQRGMGTTVTAAVMIGPRLVIGQVGDSRAYIFRKGKLVQVTKDQSLVQQLIDAKQLTEEEAKTFDKSNIILQALGTTQDIQVDMTSVVLRNGDTLIMCSDGLSGVVEPEVIVSTLREKPDPVEACKVLTDLACKGGGHDNITVIVARFGGSDLLGPDDEEDLEYRKFRYASSAETTVRSQNLLFLDKSEEKLSEPTDEIVISEGKKDAEAPGPSYSVGRAQTGLFAAAGIALLAVIAFVAFAFSSREAKKNAEKGGSTVPVRTDPAEPDRSSEKSDGKTPSPASDKEDEPVLSPTPEEMLSGTDEPISTERDIAGKAKKDAAKPNRESEAEAPKEENKTLPTDNQENKTEKEDAREPKPIDENPF